MKDISKVRWFHSIELEPGGITPGLVPFEHLNRMVDDLNLPDDMSGVTVLDIGSRDGFFSFQAERRGADVIAVDIQAIDEIGFGIARDILKSKAKFIQANIYDLTLEKIGGRQVDVIFFLGLFYHLRHPLLALDIIWNLLKPGGTLYLETAYLDEYFLIRDDLVTSLESIHPSLCDTAILQYYRNDELNPGDYSNWFSPNRKALEDILFSAGFEPQLLNKWESRILYKAEKSTGHPEYMLSEHGIDASLARWRNNDPIELEKRKIQRQYRSMSHEVHDEAGILIKELKQSRIYKLLRFLGFWHSIGNKIDDYSD